MSTKITGYVLWYSERDGNGIVRAANGVEWYVDNSAFKDRAWVPKRKDPVQGIVNESINTCRCLKDLEPGATHKRTPQVEALSISTPLGFKKGGV